MNIAAIWHQAKSEYAYAYDQETIHVLLRTAHHDWDTVHLVYGDPFDWIKNTSGQVVWHHMMVNMSKRYQTNVFDYYFIAIKPQDLRVKYTFILTKGNDRYFFGASGCYQIAEKDEPFGLYDLSEYFNYPFIHQEDDSHAPSWVHDRIWYQIFPDRFNRTKDHPLSWGKLPLSNQELYGGDLNGIIEKLPYIKDMGFNGIYLNPIFESTSAHRYNTKDYYKIDPILGTTDDFKRLLDEAHARHIKIMIDGVFNHAGYDHPWFLDVVEKGEKSPYKDCFYIDKYPINNVKFDKQGKPMRTHWKRPNFKTFAYSAHMPKWNTANLMTQDHLLGAIAFWTKLGVDAWRLDVSNEISHQFLRKIMETTRAINPEIYILGENMDNAMPWLLGDQMDAVMNYDMTRHVWKYLEHRISLVDFKDRIKDYLAKMPKHILSVMYNLVGTHDQIRIKRRLKDDVRRVKQAFIWMFSSAGQPSIYYGDEIGMTGEHDPDNRRCMVWDEQAWDIDFQSFIKRLITMRQTYTCLHDPDYDFLDGHVLAYRKKDDASELLIILNQDLKTNFQVSSNLHGSYVDLLTGRNMEIHDTIALESYDALMLKRS